MDSLNDKLDRLFAAYRDACPDPEPGPDFMPGLWSRIEARQTSTLVIRRLAGVFVTFAAALTLLMAAVLIPRFQSLPVYSATYVDVLAAEHSAENTAYAEVLPGGEGR